MTDISTGPPGDGVEPVWPVPSRLGVTAAPLDGTIVGRLAAGPAVSIHGTVRSCAVVFLVDAVAGLAVDTDPEVWSFTSDLSVRTPAIPAPTTIHARADILRAGKRSTTVAVPLTDDHGAELGVALLGFVHVPRRPGDPDKPVLDLDRLAELWSAVPPLEEPVRTAAGVEVIDAARGEVRLPLRPDLLNPAGALQGAMVGLAAEAAAEELATHALDRPQVVSDIDIRYLTQARVGPIRSRARFIGPPSDGSVVVDLLDEGLGKVVTVVTARTRDVPGT